MTFSARTTPHPAAAIIRMMMVVALLAIGCVPAMSQETPVAAAEASAVPAPEAQVSGRSVFHPREGLTVRVPAKAIYLGAERFALYGVADCEIHLFVEADRNRRVRRLYWVHFESYLPSQPDSRFTYGDIDRRTDLLGGFTWVRGTLMDTTRPPRRAGSDSERVRTMIARAGYTLPPYLASARLVRLLDDPKGTGYGRRELMLIHAEDLAELGVTREEAFGGDSENKLREPFAAKTIARAAAAFRVKAR
jgi:hypothetical protein